MYNTQLKTFVVVADCGSFTKASEKLFLSTTAIVKQISLLEEHIGVKLFERSKRGVWLTDAGRSFYNDSQELFVFSQKAIAKAQHIASQHKTILRIGSSLLNPCKAFLDRWQQLLTALEQVPESIRQSEELKRMQRLLHYTLHLVPYDDKREGILAEIAALGDKFDFLVGACDSEAWLSRSRFYKLGEYAICCAVPKKHPLASSPKLCLEDLYGEIVMIGARGDSSSVDRVRDELEKHPQIQLEDVSCFYDIDIFNTCALEKKILLSLDCWQDIHPSLVTVPVAWDFTVPYGLLYPVTPSPEILNFLKAFTALERYTSSQTYR